MLSYKYKTVDGSLPKERPTSSAFKYYIGFESITETDIALIRDWLIENTSDWGLYNRACYHNIMWRKGVITLNEYNEYLKTIEQFTATTSWVSAIDSNKVNVDDITEWLQNNCHDPFIKKQIMARSIFSKFDIYLIEFNSERDFILFKLFWK